MKKELRIISKDGRISEFTGYTSSKEEEEEEEEEEEKEESEKKGSKEASEMWSSSESSGYVASDNEVESDLESTTKSEPKCKEMEDTCERGSTLVKGGIYNYGGQHNYTCATTQVDSQIVTQVTNNVNNANANGGNGRNGNGGKNKCSYKAFLACNPRDCDRKGGAVALTRWIEKIQSMIENSGCAKNQKLDSYYFGYFSCPPKLDSFLLDQVLEVANGKKEEIDRIIRDCKLELGNSLFIIDLIPLGHGSFDVIVGMDWLSKNKAKIVCHEKVVKILLEGGEILRFQREYTLGGTKTLMSTREDEPELSDIPVVRYFTDVFLKDLSGLPPQRQVEFRIDVIPRATPVTKSPYRLVMLYNLYL
nr:putative reverse transcriptase domain-containing protein [Tanacetum cinerariifolium]